MAAFFSGELAGQNVKKLRAGVAHSGCLTTEGDVFLWGLAGSSHGMTFRTPTKMPLPGLQSFDKPKA